MPKVAVAGTENDAHLAVVGFSSSPPNVLLEAPSFSQTEARVPAMAFRRSRMAAPPIHSGSFARWFLFRIHHRQQRASNSIRRLLRFFLSTRSHRSRSRSDIDTRRQGCPRKSPKRFSASPGLQKPRSISVLILCCVAGRAIEATQAFHPDSISISGGKLATLTRRLVSAIVCLSKEAIRAASASTNRSRSASGNERFT